MEINKLPPADAPAVRAGTAAMTGQESAAAADVAPAADRADIRPLDVPAALQILLAEVRAGLDFAAAAAITPDPANAANAANLTNTSGPIDPAYAAYALVEMLLRAVPDDAGDAPAWTAALIRAETAMQASVERALNVVSLWRDVPPSVVDAVKETRALFLSVLGDDMNNPLWLRPGPGGTRPAVPALSGGGAAAAPAPGQAPGYGRGSLR